MRRTAQVAIALAVIAVVTFVVLGLVPMRVYPREYAAPPGGGRVNCGTVFSGTEWALDDACEDASLYRGGLMVGTFLFGLVASALAAILMILSRKGRKTGAVQNGVGSSSVGRWRNTALR